MKKSAPAPKQAPRWLAIALLISTLFNLILVSGAIATHILFDRSEVAIHNWSRNQLCEVNYDKHTASMNQADKKIFAALTCGRDYKTGKELDFKPVLDQVK